MNTVPGTGGTTAPPTVECKGPIVSAGASVRLSDRQFRNSLAVLFPFPVDPGTKYPKFVSKGDYSTSIDVNDVLFQDIQNFAETAESIALQAVGKIDQLLPCRPAGDEAGCAQKFIDAFAPRAYRRPLEDAERAQLLAVYNAVRQPPDPLDFNLAIAAVVSTVLQSPQFLYRLEIGQPSGMAGINKLTGYEIASRLSYLFWEAPPDEQLMQRARAGALADRRNIEAEGLRLLQSPRARDGAVRFFSEWLEAGDQVFDNRVAGPLASDFREEVQRFVQSVVFDSPTAAVKELLDTDKTILNQRLATHYGLTSPSASDTDWRQTTMPAQRRGVSS